MRKRSYQLLGHSYYYCFGEVNLIFQKGSVLCLVEVKTRTNVDIVFLLEYVTASKQEELRKTAALYLTEK